MRINAFLWNVNSAAEQTPLKISYLVSGYWVLLLSRVLTGHPLLPCSCHSWFQHSCQYVRNQSHSQCYNHAQEKEGLHHDGLDKEEEHSSPGHIAYSYDLFLFNLSCRNIIQKSDLTDKMKRCFFQAAVTSILLYGCTTWTLTKRLKKKLDGNYTRMLRAILNKSWRQTPYKTQTIRPPASYHENYSS